MASPSEAALDLAYSFLSQNGIHTSQVEKTDDNQTLSFWVEIEKANRMRECFQLRDYGLTINLRCFQVNADFAVHKLDARSLKDSNSTNRLQRRSTAALYQLGTKEYSLPQALAQYVGHINPGSDFRE